MDTIKVIKKGKTFKLKGKTPFYDSIMEKDGWNARSLNIYNKKGKREMDIRIDYSLQEKSGSTYRSLLHKLEIAKNAIKCDEFDAMLILINREAIPEKFIQMFMDKIREDRFIYVKVYDGRPSDDKINNDIINMSEILLQLRNAERKMKKYCISQ